MFSDNRDSMQLLQFLMPLRDEFEHARASLLQRLPLPSLKSAVVELIYEETKLKTLHLTGFGSSDIVLTKSSNQCTPSKNHDQPRGRADAKF